MALGVGVEGHKAFLQQDRASSTACAPSCPRAPQPIVPPRWGELNTITIAFGHGIAVAPLQAAMAVARAGQWRQPDDADLPASATRRARRAIGRAGHQARDQRGDALPHAPQRRRRAPARRPTCRATSSAARPARPRRSINGRYSKTKPSRPSWRSFPTDKPKYAVPDHHGRAAGRARDRRLRHRRLERGADRPATIIERVAPLLGVPPRFEPPVQPVPDHDRARAHGATR